MSALTGQLLRPEFPIIDIRRLDVTELDQIQGFISAIERDYGRLDVVVNNAGFALLALLKTYCSKS